MAGGIATQGLIPVVNSFASFLAARPNEQIYNNATEGNKIIYACHFSGIIPAGPGKSHQSVRDISLFSTLPNATIIQPCNSIEVKKALRYFIKEGKGVCVLRMNIGPSPQIIKLPENHSLEKGIGTIIANGNDGCIVSYGPVMLNEALLARKILLDYNIEIRVVNMPWLNFIDDEFIEYNLMNDKSNYIVEDHMQCGGLFDHINAKLSQCKNNIKINCLGLNQFPKCGNPVEVLEYHELNYINIAKQIAKDCDMDLIADVNVEIADYSEAPQ